MCGPQPDENGSLREGRGPGMPGPYREAMKKGGNDHTILFGTGIWEKRRYICQNAGVGAGMV